MAGDRRAVKGGPDRGLQVEGHDRDDHGHHAVAERFEPMGVNGIAGTRRGWLRVVGTSLTGAVPPTTSPSDHAQCPYGMIAYPRMPELVSACGRSERSMAYGDPRPRRSHLVRSSREGLRPEKGQ